MLENLKARHRLYASRLATYKKALAEWEKEQQEKKVIEQAREQMTKQTKTLMDSKDTIEIPSPEELESPPSGSRPASPTRVAAMQSVNRPASRAPSKI